MNKSKKRPYAKPGIVYRGKVDVMSAVCNSTYLPGSTCRIAGIPTCVKVRY